MFWLGLGWFCVCFGCFLVLDGWGLLGLYEWCCCGCGKLGWGIGGLVFCCDKVVLGYVGRGIGWWWSGWNCFGWWRVFCFLLGFLGVGVVCWLVGWGVVNVGFVEWI